MQSSFFRGCGIISLKLGVRSSRPERRRDGNIMIKITFMGAGSTVFAKNVLGDCMCTEALRDAEIALYDIDAGRLEDSNIIINSINHAKGSHATIKTYLGVENRKEALRTLSSTPFRSADTSRAR